MRKRVLHETNWQPCPGQEAIELLCMQGTVDPFPVAFGKDFNSKSRSLNLLSQNAIFPLPVNLQSGDFYPGGGGGGGGGGKGE